MHLCIGIRAGRRGGGDGGFFRVYLLIFGGLGGGIGSRFIGICLCRLLYGGSLGVRSGFLVSLFLCLLVGFSLGGILFGFRFGRFLVRLGFGLGGGFIRLGLGFGFFLSFLVVHRLHHHIGICRGGPRRRGIGGLLFEQCLGKGNARSSLGGIVIVIGADVQTDYARSDCAQEGRKCLENVMPISYANSWPEAIAFAGGAYNLRHSHGAGHASTDHAIIA